MTNECPMNAPDPGAELKFPLMCHYKVIAENREGMHFCDRNCIAGIGGESTAGNWKYVGEREIYHLYGQHCGGQSQKR